MDLPVDVAGGTDLDGREGDDQLLGGGVAGGEGRAVNVHRIALLLGHAHQVALRGADLSGGEGELLEGRHIVELHLAIGALALEGEDARVLDLAAGAGAVRVKGGEVQALEDDGVILLAGLLGEERAHGLLAADPLVEAAQGLVVLGGVGLLGELDGAGEGELASLRVALAGDIVGGTIALEDGVLGEERGLAEGAEATELNRLARRAGGGDNPVVLARGLVEAVEEEVDHPKAAREEGQGDHRVAGLVGQGVAGDLGGELDLQGLGDVLGVGGGEGEGVELGTGEDALEDTVKAVADALDGVFDEERAVGGVVQAAEVERGREGEGAGRVEFALGGDAQAVLLG